MQTILIGTLKINIQVVVPTENPSNNIPNIPPTITLVGANPLEIAVDTLFVDPGATAADTEDGDLTSQIITNGSVNTSVEGSYTITYSVSDSQGASISVNRVVVVDSEIIACFQIHLVIQLSLLPVRLHLVKNHYSNF